MKAPDDRQIFPPILTLRRSKGKDIVDTDACDRQVGAFLLQAHPGVLQKSILYWSKSPTPVKLSYNTTEGECLAIIWALLLVRHYLEGSGFSVRANNSALQWVLKHLEWTAVESARFEIHNRRHFASFQGHSRTTSSMVTRVRILHRTQVVVKGQMADQLSQLDTHGLKIVQLTTIFLSWPSSNIYLWGSAMQRTISSVAYVTTTSTIYQQLDNVSQRNDNHCKPATGCTRFYRPTVGGRLL